MKHRESELQSSCVRWFRYQHPTLSRLLFAIPNGGKRNVITASILKREGAMAGVADMFLAIPSPPSDLHGLFIEFKVGRNELSEHQEAFKAAVEKMGYGFTICRSFDEFFSAVNSYLHGEIVHPVAKEILSLQ